MGSLLLLTRLALTSNCLSGSVPDSFCSLSSMITMSFDAQNGASSLGCYPTCLTSITGIVLTAGGATPGCLSADDNAGLCGLIASTNIVTSYTEWKCNEFGFPTVTNPCGSWTGIVCSGAAAGGAVVKLTVHNLMATLTGMTFCINRALLRWLYGYLSSYNFSFSVQYCFLFPDVSIWQFICFLCRYRNVACDHWLSKSSICLGPGQQCSARAHTEHHRFPHSLAACSVAGKQLLWSTATGAGLAFAAYVTESSKQFVHWLCPFGPLRPGCSYYACLIIDTAGVLPFLPLVGDCGSYSTTGLCELL